MKIIVDNSGLKYSLLPGDVTLEVVGGDVSKDVIDVPKEYQGKKVVAIAEGAFKNHKFLRSVTIGDNVERIGDGAFAFCFNLEKITLPKALKKLGKTVFMYDENLCGISLDCSVDEIGDNAFEGCLKIKSIVVPNSVKKIGDSAFYGCKALSDVHIGSAVWQIREKAFYGCENLTNISVDSASVHFKSMDGNLYSYDGKKLVKYAVGKKDALFSVPGGVESIRDGAFFGATHLTDVTLPATTVKICKKAYENCHNLSRISLNNGLNIIEDRAFFNCLALSYLELPKSLVKIGTLAFYGCTSLVTINNYSSINVLPGKETHGHVGFYAKNVYLGKKGVFGNKLTRLPRLADFKKSGDKLIEYVGTEQEITIPEGITKIGKDAFKGKDVIKVIIPSSVTIIDEGAFEDCSKLQEVVFTLGSRLMKICDYAFFKCVELKRINLPKRASVTAYSFIGCDKLRK